MAATHKLQLAQFMTRGIATLPPEASLQSLARQMRGQKLSCVVIVRQGRPVGIVSERDCVRILADSLEGIEIGKLEVADIMTSPVVSVSADLTWLEALELARRRQIRRLPVVDEQGKLVGLVTQSDLLEAQKTAFQHYREELEVEIAERARDITQARDEAEKALHGSREFLATMTHEIRTPLGGVIGVAELLSDTKLTRQQAEWVQTIIGAGRALSTLINDLLDYARMESTQVEVEQIPFSWLEVLEEVADLSALKAQSKGVELRLVYDPLAPATIGSDPARFRQLLTNLCGNAVKFTERGEVAIHAHFVERQERGGRLRVEVRDTGIGISRERQARLFKAYSQADETISRRFGGTGLGLAISRKLVEALDGEIGLKSTPNVGSTFWFELSVGIMEPEPEAPVPSESVVTVIDNSGATAADLRRMLAALGLQVRVFGAATDALDACEETTEWAAVFARFPLPERGEKQALDDLRERLTETPIYLITDIADHALAAGMAHHGYAGALTRPIKRRPLRDALASVLDVPKLDESARRGLRVKSVVARENCRLLLAEDNKINQMVLQQQLRRLGYECTVVADGEQAVSAFRERTWDLILLDMHMPLMDGPSAARQIRRIEAERESPPVKVLALTAGDTPPERDRCLAAGMDGFLAKPIQLEDLEAALAAHLSVSAGLPLTPMQTDALTELINIGVGRGAAELSALLDMEVQLSVPRVETVGGNHLPALTVGLEGGAWSCVQLAFDGAFGGNATLLFSERGAASLVSTLESGTAGDGDGGAQALKEVGNIVLNALIGSFTNTLEAAVRFDVPEYTRGSVARLMASDLYFGANTLLMARTRIVVRDLAIEGIVLVVLGLSSFERLLSLIDRATPSDLPRPG